MSIYVVNWARAIGGDGIPTDAYCGCVGVYTSLPKARESMLQDIHAMLQDIRDGFEDAEDLIDFEASLKCSDGDFFYEIDYKAPDGALVQFYYSIQEVDNED